MNIGCPVSKCRFFFLFSALIICTHGTTWAQRKSLEPDLAYADMALGEANRELRVSIEQMEAISKEALITSQQLEKVVIQLEIVREQLLRAKAEVARVQFDEDRRKTHVILSALAADGITDTNQSFEFLFDRTGLTLNGQKQELSEALEKKYRALFISLYGNRANEDDYHWRLSHGPLKH